MEEEIGRKILSKACEAARLSPWGEYDGLMGAQRETGFLQGAVALLDSIRAGYSPLAVLDSCQRALSVEEVPAPDDVRSRFEMFSEDELTALSVGLYAGMVESVVVEDVAERLRTEIQGVTGVEA